MVASSLLVRHLDVRQRRGPGSLHGWWTDEEKVVPGETDAVPQYLGEKSKNVNDILHLSIRMWSSRPYMSSCTLFSPPDVSRPADAQMNCLVFGGNQRRRAQICTRGATVQSIKEDLRYPALISTHPRSKGAGVTGRCCIAVIEESRTCTNVAFSLRLA